MNDVGLRLRDRLRLERDALVARYTAGGPVEALLKGLARSTDGLLRELAQSTGLDQHAALVAVGGYGRGELFPHSDIDVLILLEQDADGPQRETIERLVSLLWDLGLTLGHSVRTLDDCEAEARADVTVLTSLLEARPICGPRRLFLRLQRAIGQSLDRTAYFRAKVLEQRQRHIKYNESPFSLEPNVKECPGGLRDLHVLLWIGRATGYGRTWAELARNGLITAEEAGLIRRSERRIRQIRAWLHLVTGRREDRLVFDVQHAVAERAGFHATSARRSSEVMMQRYYWSAKAVTQMNTIVLQNIELRLLHTAEEPAVPLDETFVTRSELLDLRAPDALDSDPNAIVRAFLLMAQHQELRGMSAPLMRALWHARVRIDARYRRDPRNRATFLSILQQPKGVLHEMRRMNQLSVLGRYLPVFRRIVGQMQHDLFHVYTVDQHILQVLRNLRRFTLAEHAHEYPLCSQLISDFDKPWLLYIAALFHDIAKGRGGDHSVLGGRDARRFCREHGLEPDDTALVVFLVEHHLAMSQVAQKQDLADETVIRRFAGLVKNERRLVALYLLTVADIRGTSPKVWNAWKGKLLEDLFRSTRRLLGGGSVSPTAVLEGRKEEALRILRLYGLSDSAREALWEQLDVVYFLRHSAQDIAWHTRSLFARVRTDKPVVRARLARIGEGAEVLIYVQDQKDLFARVCGYFDSRNLSILDARIHTTRHGYALDTFLVTDNGRTPHYRELLAQVEHELAEWIAKRHELPATVKGRMSRQSRHFPVTPEVRLAPDERGSRWLVSVTATDRLGLLYSIARALARHDLNVHTAKVLTLGERAEDIFLVSGAELGQERNQLEIEQDLLEAIAP
ncbi:MAG TPA: [protein-PII] uridylyltransferase [Burkholderiaceae bacterium]|nr:[protein-PII] uridylyltransferase [Burkholderiaceae bacterium]HQR70989.1 [protein-PII] uridylyltransferase [Burkholderiaceae bacterium]